MPAENPHYRHERPRIEKDIDHLVGSVPKDLIRIQHVPPAKDGKQVGEIQEMWGFITINNLPLVFRAWPSSDRTQTNPHVSTPANGDRNWFVHAPKNPAEFSATIFTDPIDQNDMIHVLEVLGENSESLSEGTNTPEDLKNLYQDFLEDNAEQYNAFQKDYKDNGQLRTAYVAAVNRICREMEREENQAQELRKKADLDTIKK